MSISVPLSPPWAPEQLLPSMRAYLRANNVVRLPGDPRNGLPPLWLDPKRGIPYPGQTEGLKNPGTESDPNLVMSANPATGIVSAPFEGFLVRLNAVIWYRGKNTPICQAKHEEIRRLLHDKRDYSMNGLLVNESMFFRELQRISADERGFTYNCEVAFTLWAENYDY